MLTEIYNDTLIRLAANIPRVGRLENADATASAHSKMCGSTITVYLNMEEDIVTDYAHEVKACLLGQSAAAIMAINIIGTNKKQLRQLRAVMQKMLKDNGAPPNKRWSDLALLEPVRDYKGRHASTLLVFDAVEDAISQIEHKQNQSD